MKRLRSAGFLHRSVRNVKHSSVWNESSQKESILHIVENMHSLQLCVLSLEILQRLHHNEELHRLYSSPSIIRMIKSRRMRWAGHVARMKENRSAYRILVGKPEGKRPLGRPRHRWVDNITMDLREIGWDGVDWIGLIWLRIGTSGGLL
jgi:hypothetical protein